MNILITGGNGFLGYNVAKLLLNSGYNVLVLSRSSNRFTSKITQKFKFCHITSNSYNSHEEVIRDFSPNVVIHFAWAGGNNYNDINRIDQYDTNIQGSISLLEIINKLKYKPKFIGVGSFAEYGIITTKAVETQHENPINHYGLAKNVFKNISKLFCSINDIQWLWIRPCYIYGNEDVSTRFLPSVITKLKIGEQVVLDSCNTIIDYLHVNDFSRAVLLLIGSDQLGVYNICSGQEYHLRDIINTIIDNTGTVNTIIFDESKDRKYTSKYICGDNTKLIETTTWTPEIDIYTGIVSLI